MYVDEDIMGSSDHYECNPPSNAQEHLNMSISLFGISFGQ